MKNEPAFPSLERGKGWEESAHLGITKREYFAARAMQGMLTGIIKEGTVIRTTSDSNKLVEELILDVIVSGAYEIADAMLEELDK